MNWSDERYVRVYTRDTLNWQALSFDAQALLALLLRKVDRAGVLEVGRLGGKGIAVAIGHGHLWERLEPALNELLRDGCVTLRDAIVTVPNFVEAQEAVYTDAARARASRERRRDMARVTPASRDVTSQNEPSHGVPAASRNVSPTSRVSGHESRNDQMSARMSLRTVPSVPAVPSIPSGPPDPEECQNDTGGVRSGPEAGRGRDARRAEPQWNSTSGGGSPVGSVNLHPEPAWAPPTLTGDEVNAEEARQLAASLLGRVVSAVAPEAKLTPPKSGGVNGTHK